jgi:CVNH domain
VRNLLGAVAALALAGSLYGQPALAQPAPQGSYLNSCTHVDMDRDRLIADCRRPDGGWHRTVLDINRCAGDIANINGQLSCNRGPGPGYGSSRGPGPGYGYGSSRSEDWRSEQRARCWHILDSFERDRCWNGY